MIDLRSDTVTRPTAQMRRIIADAVVGDDVHGDDPTVNALEARVAEMFGKEAALFVPSGTMGNLISLASLAQPGDEIIVERWSHVFNYEVASAAALLGVQMNAVDGTNGQLTAELIEPHVRKANLHSPGTRVISLENTHNRAGGRIFPYEEMKRVRALAEAHGVSVHLDGARLANAHVETGVSFRDYAACCDTVTMCFSKGLGAPVGSIVASTGATIALARRKRKQLGGGMRQTGLLAAAADYALDHHIERLRDDHANARRLGAAIDLVEGLRVDHEVETNIVIFEVDSAVFSVDDVLAQLERLGVLAVGFGPGRIRMVANLDVSSGDIDETIAALGQLTRR